MISMPTFRSPLARWQRRRRDRPLVFFSERYRVAISASPLDPWRAERIVTSLAQLRLLNEAQLRPAPAISWKALARVHDQAYLESLTQPGSVTRAFGFEIGPEQQETLLDAQRRMCHATVLAAQAALAGRVGINLGGGLHHAEPAAGKGFCLINDIAVAVSALREGGFAGRVLVIDLDLHDGDGTRICFAEDPTVHTFSIHNETWDDRPAVASTILALGADVDDTTFWRALTDNLPDLVANFEPELVFYLAGVDGSSHDALGNWKLSRECLLARDALVHELVRARREPLALVVTLAGGYGDHAWRPSARYIGWVLSGGKVPELPQSDRVLLDRYLNVAGAIRSSELGGDDPHEDNFGLTEADILGGLDGSAPAPRRFLDFYTTPGLELALERTGFLDRVRSLGYPRPHVSVDVGSPAGDTLRIWGDSSQRDLLCELRVRRDRSLLADASLLFVEWLLLQNPRREFAPDRPRLPGQDHPGLGLLKDVVALLVAACRRIGCDGIAATAAHFHLVRQGSKWFHVLEPRQAQLFLELEAELAGVPLSDASRRLAAGPLITSDGRTLSWEPITMVMPVSERLAGRLSSLPPIDRPLEWEAPPVDRSGASG